MSTKSAPTPPYLKQVIVLRKHLGMSAGKVPATAYGATPIPYPITTLGPVPASPPAMSEVRGR
jgi:hypothetical protein